MRPFLLMVLAAAVGAFARALLEAERKRAPSETSRSDAHDPTCRAETKSGARCSRPAEPGSAYCWQHGG